MKRIVDTPYHSRRIGSLPRGCSSCVRGAKLVLLATGVCGSRCWYCPLSERKKNRDVVVANEWWVKSDKDIIAEAKLTKAEGAGITGGDPLCRLERTIHYIRLLKRTFGEKFHIHLYAPTTHTTAKALKRLHSAGLDEIRFHPWFIGGKPDIRPLREALEYDWDVGCEIPVVPGSYKETVAFIKAIDELGVSFLNLNQFEVSETNAEALEKRGFEAESDISFAVRGSAKMAEKLLKFCAKNTGLRVHYCTVKLKDGVQLRNRLKRRAKNVAREFDIVTDEGLLIRGALYPLATMPSYSYKDNLDGMRPGEKAALLAALKTLRKNLIVEHGIPAELIEVDCMHLRLLTGAWIAEELAKEFMLCGLQATVVEEYPTWDALITDLNVL
jgi:uncharacterized protein